MIFLLFKKILPEKNWLWKKSCQKKIGSGKNPARKKLALEKISYRYL
jgi:hypothetical protein